jgi:hypothetical protein
VLGLQFLPAVQQPRPPDIIADGHALVAEQHVQIALGAAQRRGDLVDAKIRIAQMFADEGLGPNVHRFGTDAIEHRVGLAQRQQQQIDERISDANSVVGRESFRFVKRGVHEVVGDSAGAVARGELARQHLRCAEAAFVKQFLWHNHDLVPGQRGADDRVRTGNVIGEAVARHDVDATAALFEMRDAVGLEQYLDVGMLAQFCA